MLSSAKLILTLLQKAPYEQEVWQRREEGPIRSEQSVDSFGELIGETELTSTFVAPLAAVTADFDLSPTAVETDVELEVN